MRSVSIDDRLDRFGFCVDTNVSVGTHPSSHRHQGVEILLVHLGDVVATANGWRGTVRAGQALIWSGRQPHSIRPVEKSFVRTAIHFLPDHVAPGGAARFIESLLEAGGGLVLTMDGPSSRRIFWASQELRRMYEGEAVPAETLRYLLGLILSDLERLSGKTPGEKDPVSITNVMYYMGTHLDRNDTLEALAARFYISERQLYRLFEEHLNCSPKRYWLGLKMEKACELLHTSMSVAEIAAAVGFASVSGFERAFRREVGMSVPDYRAGLEGLCGDERSNGP